MREHSSFLVSKIKRYRWGTMYRAQVACKGCGITFESHQRSRLFCCYSCKLAYQLATLGSCVQCSEKVPFEHTIGLYRNEPGTPLGDFHGQHVACRATFLEKVGREDDCRCAQCKKRKDIADTLPRKGQRRATFHGKHRQTILERDNYICQICGLPTDPDVSPSADTYPTVDHIIRVVDGGEDELYNLRTAHKWCNTTSSASVFGDGWVRERALLRFGQ
ncbi:HNH endonuclease [Pseudarthrobacter oxydans]|uniref:HNH endonuclease n=1 Tax=Pseudarthrobacter oxydans TaxID=1671 RepID=UPI003D288961